MSVRACSFCGTRLDRSELVRGAGDGAPYICRECARAAVSIIVQRAREGRDFVPTADAPPHLTIAERAGAR